MQKAAIYCRFSSDNQREESIDAQVRAIREHCDKNKISIVKIYSDEAKSATTDDRPQFLNMIKDSSKGIFDLVIVHKLDRFARNRYDSAIYRKKFKENGVRLISVLEPLDDSPESIILESVLEGMAEYYSKNLAREAMKGMKENALKAKHNGGVPPLGYDVIKGDYFINDIEADTVRQIFELYAAGNGYLNISKVLNNQNRKTRSKKEFGKNSIREILSNEKYIGVYTFNKRASKANNHVYKNEEDIIRVPDAIPRIIDDETFYKIQGMFGRRVGMKIKKEYYMLTGKLFCGECESAYTGSGYVGGRGGKKYYQYSCNKRENGKDCANKPIRKDIIEGFVIEQLKIEVLNPKKIGQLAEKLYAHLNDTNKLIKVDIETAKKDLQTAQKKIDKTYDMYYDGILDKEECANKINDLKLEKDKITLYIVDMESKDYSYFDKTRVIEYLRLMMAKLDSEDPKDKKKVIDTFVDRIYICSGDIKIKFKLDDAFMDRDNAGSGSPPPELSLSIVKNYNRKSAYK